MWTPTTITSHVSEHAQKVRLLLCSCDVLFMLSPNFVISHKKEYVSIFCTWSLFLSFSLCFYQKDLPLPRKNSRWVLPLFNPSFLLSILSLYHPSTPWGKHNVLHGQKTIIPSCGTSCLSKPLFPSVHEAGKLSGITSMLFTFCLKAMRMLQ